MPDPSALSYKQQLKFAIAGVNSRDLQQTSVAAARAVLRALKQNKQHLKAAVQDLVNGIDVAPKRAVKPRLQLAEYAVLECATHECLVQLLPTLSQQANVVLAAHRQDAGCINSLAALLSSCVAKLLHGCQGSCAAAHGSDRGLERVTAECLCDALLFPVIKSTYRDPEQVRVSAGSVVLVGLFEVLKAHTDLPAVIEAVRRCQGLMLQLMAAGTVAERAPGVFLPVCHCVEVLGLSMDREATRRLLKLAVRAATSQSAWQVRRDACQALAVLAASLQFRALSAQDGEHPAAAAQELLMTPAVELLIAQKPVVLEMLDDARFDRITAVRAAAAAAWAEFRCLPELAFTAGDALPVGQSDVTPGSGSKLDAKLKLGSGRANKRTVGAGGLSLDGRQHLPPPRFVRPKLPPGTERDFGVLVFAPPGPPPPPPQPVSPEHSEADTSQAHGSDQSPVARQLLFEANQRVGTPVDAASQTGEGDPAAQHPYSVESPLSGSTNPMFAARSSLEHAQLQQQLAQQLQQQQLPGLPSLLAATGFGSGSPVRLDISHHVHGRVELAHSASSSPGPPPQAVPQPRSPANTSAAGAAGDLLAALAASAVGNVGAELGHSVQNINATWSEPRSQQPPEQQQQAAEEQVALGSTCAADMAFEPSFGPACAASDTGVTAATVSSGADQPSAADDPAASLLCAAAPGPSQAAVEPFECFAQAEAPLPAALSAADPADAEPARMQRSRWQLPPVRVSHGEGECSPSSQRTPTGADAAPKSPSSLDVLRSVGERVQLLLETISRQTSNSSRQGSRSPTAPQVGQAALGPTSVLGAAPLAQALFQGGSGGSSVVASPRSASSPGHAWPDAAVLPAGAAAAAASVFEDEGQHLLLPADRVPLVLAEHTAVVELHQQPAVQHTQDEQLPQAADMQASLWQGSQAEAVGEQSGRQASLELDTAQGAAVTEVVQQLQLPMQGLPEQLQGAPSQQQAWAGQEACDSVQLQQSEQQLLQESRVLQQQQNLLQPQELLHHQQQQQSLPQPLRHEPQLQTSQELQSRISQEQVRQSQELQQLHSVSGGLPADADAAAQASPGQLQVELDVAAVAGTAAAPGSSNQPTLQLQLAQPQSCDGAVAAGGGEGVAVSTNTALLHGVSGAAPAPIPTDADAAAVCCLTHALGLQSPGSASPQVHSEGASGECRVDGSGGGGSSSCSPCEEEQQVDTSAEHCAGAVMAQELLTTEQDLVADAALQPAVALVAAADAGQPPDGVASSTAPDLLQGSPAKQMPQQDEALQQQELPAAPVSATERQQEWQLQEVPMQQQLLQLLLAPDFPGAEQRPGQQQAQDLQLGSPAQHSWQQPITQDMLGSYAGEASPGSVTQPSSLSAAQDMLATLEAPAQDTPAAAAATDVQQPSLAAPADLGCISMQYNQLFQPQHEAQGGDDAAWETLDSAAGLSVAAAAPAASAGGTGPDSTAGGVLAVLPGETAGLSRVDQALEKLQSLRSTLRTISSSGSVPSSTAVSARGSLANSRATSMQLGAADTCGTAIPAARQVQSCTGALQDGVGAAASAEGAATAVSVGSRDTAPAAAGSALASAKDWILEISQRLQQVGGPEQPGVIQDVQGALGVSAVQAHNAPPVNTAVWQPASEQHISVEPSNASLSAAAIAEAEAAASAGRQDTAAGIAGCVVDSQSSTLEQLLPGSAAPISSTGHANLVAAQATGLQEAASSPQRGQVQMSGAAAESRPAKLRVPYADVAGQSTLADGGTSSSSDGRYGSLLPGYSSPRVQQSTAAAAAAEETQPVTGAVEGAEVASCAHGRQPHPQLVVQQGAIVEQQLQQQVVEAAAGTTLAAAVLRDEAAVVMAESRQRLQQLLVESDDTMLLMSFALKLERLGRRFGAHETDGGRLAGSRCMEPPPDNTSPLDTPRSQLPGLASPGGAASPPSWQVTHNSLYNTSVASTPVKP